MDSSGTKYAQAGRTLMTGTLGLNLLDNCDNTSASRGWCFNIFLIFMMRTMAACQQTKAIAVNTAVTEGI